MLKSQKEAILEKQIVVTTIEISNAFDKLLEKYELHKALRVLAWVNRFIKICHHFEQSGHLTAFEIEKKEKFYIKSEQKRLESSNKFQQDRKSLDLIQNAEGIYECKGRVQGSYPIYLLKQSLLTENIIRAADKTKKYRLG